VHGFGLKARFANGQYQERHRTRSSDSPFFEKVGGGAYLYKQGIRWCFGPVLDGAEVWASIERALKQLPAGQHEILCRGVGRPEIVITRTAVTIIQGGGFRSGDLNGLSDPYVVVTVPGKPHLNFKTSILQQALNPIWREKFEIDGVELGDTLRIRVMDFDDDSEDDLVGVAKYMIVPGGFNGELVLRLRGRAAGTLRMEVTLPVVSKETSIGSRHGRIDFDTRCRTLVSALSHGGDDSVRAVQTLQDTATTDELRSCFVALGAVQSLVPMLSEGPAENRLRAAAALSNLGQINAGRRVIISAGGVHALLGVFFSAPLRGKEEAMGALLVLVDSQDVCTEVIAAGAVPALIALLPHAGTAASRAAQLLAFSSVSPEVAAYIIEENALQPLVKLVSIVDGGGDASAHAAFALANLANCDEHREAVIEANALPSLIGLLINGSSEARAQAASAITALAEADDPRSSWNEMPFGPDFLVREGVVPPLLALLSSHDNEGVEQAAMALCTIASSAQASASILANGALPKLLPLLRSRPKSDGPESLERRALVAEVVRALATFNQRLMEAALPRDRDKKLVNDVLEQSWAEQAMMPVSRPSSAQSFVSTRPSSAKSFASTLTLAKSSSGSSTLTLAKSDALATPGLASTLLLARSPSSGELQQSPVRGMHALQRSRSAATGRNSGAKTLELGVDLRFVAGSHAYEKTQKWKQKDSFQL